LRERSYAKMQALKLNPLRPEKGLEIEMANIQRRDVQMLAMALASL